jgi:circadian clock protein KaiC
VPGVDLIRTGIYGLDDIFHGGITKGNIILVEGEVGTGKTLLGIEFIYRGIAKFGEPGVVVVFETAPQKLLRDTAGFGWKLDEWQQQNKLKLVFTSPEVLHQELRTPDSVLFENAAEIGAKRIFIDGISLLSALSNGGANGEGSYRELLLHLFQGLERANLTAMLSHEIIVHEKQTPSLEIAEFLSDTVILLKRERHGRGIRRTLEIEKSRGQDFDSGQHTLRITATGQSASASEDDPRFAFDLGEPGLQIFRRVQSAPRRIDPQPTSDTMHSVIGCEPLDALIGGGIFDGSTTMVAGVSGVGKTVLGVQVLTEGARNQDHRGLLVSLDEHPSQILRNAQTLGLDLQKHVDDGSIGLLYECPQELDIDAHFDRIVRTIEANKIDRLVIDGMTSYSSALDDHQLYRDFFHALVAYSKQHSLTTFFAYENSELFGVTQFIPQFAVSSIVDNIILLNLVELGNTLRRAMTVAKARGSAHQFITREFKIGKGGISLVPPDEGPALPVLPFASYYGLLSRAPTRLSPILQGSRNPIEDPA